jgi:hypothetical protein
MAEVVQESPQEFWQPPLPPVVAAVSACEIVPVMAEVCPRCGTEFLLASKFCHSCGARRPEVRPEMASNAQADAAEFAGLWEHAVTRVRSLAADLPLDKVRSSAGAVWRRVKIPAWLHYLHFHEIQRWTGLSTASLVAFVLGVACIAGALLVGLLTAKTFGEWQAIQFYRAEWLLGATASFVAGILLKRPTDRDE